MKRIYFVFMILIISVISGCSNSNNEEVEQFILDAFKSRADAVFLYKDKKALSQYFSPEALEQSKDYLAWSPGPWNNIKDMKYSSSLRIDKLKVDGKRATAQVYETVVVTWDYIDPGKVMGAEFVKEDAWSNRKHLVTLILSPEGKWLIEQDIVP